MYNIASVRTTSPRVLVTGASGAVGTVLVSALAGSVSLRQADLRPVRHPSETDDVVVGDLADPSVAARAVDCVDAVVHLAGIPTAGASWDALMQANLLATATLLDAAARAGVGRLVLASSVHVTGGYNDPTGWPVSPDWAARPCCRYGASKATGELLAQIFAAERTDVSVVALRLGLVADRPRWTGEARGWTPSTSLGAVVRAALAAPSGYQVHFAVAEARTPRYDTSSLRPGLGIGASAPFDAVKLSEQKPPYAQECRLWAGAAVYA